jgi:polyferredoxin
MRPRDLLRTSIQAASTLLFNLHMAGWRDGTLYAGWSKSLCLPGLHCYSCPSAISACPVGTVQNLLSTPAVTGGLASGALLPTLAGVLGMVMLPGFIAGRIACSHACPFGFLQDLLHLIPAPRLRPGNSLAPASLFMLAVFVLALPLLLRPAPGSGGDPWFCKVVCPAGTVGAGWPLVLFDGGETLRTGFLFAWKSAVAVLVLAASVPVSRPFCRWLCPLGAAWGLAGRVSVFRMRVSDSCTRCGACGSVCPSGIEIWRNPSSASCIRCGRCVPRCPAGAIRHTAGS